jgi:hypothetical protein
VQCEITLIRIIFKIYYFGLFLDLATTNVDTLIAVFYPLPNGSSDIVFNGGLPHPKCPETMRGQPALALLSRREKSPLLQYLVNGIPGPR